MLGRQGGPEDAGGGKGSRAAPPSRWSRSRDRRALALAGGAGRLAGLRAPSESFHAAGLSAASSVLGTCAPHLRRVRAVAPGWYVARTPHGAPQARRAGAKQANPPGLPPPWGPALASSPRGLPVAGGILAPGDLAHNRALSAGIDPCEFSACLDKIIVAQRRDQHPSELAIRNDGWPARCGIIDLAGRCGNGNGIAIAASGTRWEGVYRRRLRHVRRERWPALAHRNPVGPDVALAPQILEAPGPNRRRDGGIIAHARKAHAAR